MKWNSPKKRKKCVICENFFLPVNGNVRICSVECGFQSMFVEGNKVSCWEWKGRKLNSGYGSFSAGGEGRLAHRYAYERTCGGIPMGMEVCHTCDNPTCVNPNHLFIGSRKDNMQDCLKKGRMNLNGLEKGRKYWIGARHREESIKKISLSRRKFTENQEKEIVSYLSQGCLQKDVASFFGAAQQIISRIYRKHRYG